MKDCKSIIANIAFEVCAFLKTKRLPTKHTHWITGCEYFSLYFI